MEITFVSSRLEGVSPPMLVQYLTGELRITMNNLHFE